MHKTGRAAIEAVLESLPRHEPRTEERAEKFLDEIIGLGRPAIVAQSKGIVGQVRGIAEAYGQLDEASMAAMNRRVNRARDAALLGLVTDAKLALAKWLREDTAKQGRGAPPPAAGAPLPGKVVFNLQDNALKVGRKVVLLTIHSRNFLAALASDPYAPWKRGAKVDTDDKKSPSVDSALTQLKRELKSRGYPTLWKELVKVSRGKGVSWGAAKIVNGNRATTAVTPLQVEAARARKDGTPVRQREKPKA